MNKIKFSNADLIFLLKNKKAIKNLILDLFKKERTSLFSLHIIFCSDKYLLKLNKRYLAHDYYTDILTFDLAPQGSPKIAELYISIDRVKENSVLLGIFLDLEIYRVIIHGCLHLCGYSDSTLLLKTRIHKKEDYYLKKLSFYVSRETL